ncbi:MAG TPA: hypothetical protein VNN76_12255 [Bacteroidota bacterium]|nr:hypothetical protein [Bacteroidota bacterium]
MKAILLIIVLWLAGCVLESSDDAVEFGASYRLLERTTAPLLTQDSLFVAVSYSGCNGNHIFILRYRAAGFSAAEVWLFKQTGDEPCDRHIEETKRFALPAVIKSSERVTLLGPYDKRIILRGGPPSPDLPTARLAVFRIDSATVEGNSVIFQLTCAEPEAGCWRYLRKDYSVDGRIYFVTVWGQRKTTEPCLAVLGSLNVITAITLPGPGTYEFKFWQYDRTKDTTLTVP